MKGIMFKESLFKMVVDGRKTQTRRICTEDVHHHFLSILDNGNALFTDLQNGEFVEIKPRYRVGDVVYMKEPCFLNKESECVEYKYDGKCNMPLSYYKNKMFMPAKHARYFILITDVRCEELMDIYKHEGDAQAEGCEDNLEYLRLWDEINGKNSHRQNPYVWVYTFELCSR